MQGGGGHSPSSVSPFFVGRGQRVPERLGHLWVPHNQLRRCRRRSQSSSLSAKDSLTPASFTSYPWSSVSQPLITDLIKLIPVLIKGKQLKVNLTRENNYQGIKCCWRLSFGGGVTTHCTTCLWAPRTCASRRGKSPVRMRAGGTALVQSGSANVCWMNQWSKV